MNAKHLPVTIFILISALYINYISNVTFNNDIYTTSYIALKLIPLYILYKLIPMFAGLSWYRIKTAIVGLKRLFFLPRQQKLACIEAYAFLQRIQTANATTKTEEETIAVTNYYNVLNEVLSIADIEKMYIPPLLNAHEGLYANQLLCEKAVFEHLKLDATTMHNSHLLDCGCGRGRIAHLFATFSGT